MKWNKVGLFGLLGFVLVIVWCSIFDFSSYLEVARSSDRTIDILDNFAAPVLSERSDFSYWIQYIEAIGFLLGPIGGIVGVLLALVIYGRRQNIKGD